MNVAQSIRCFESSSGKAICGILPGDSIMRRALGSLTTSNASLTVYAARLGSLAHSNSGQFQFTLTGPAGYNFIIETSTDLISWSTLTNLFNSTGTIQFTDVMATNGTQRFYRVKLVE